MTPRDDKNWIDHKTTLLYLLFIYYMNIQNVRPVGCTAGCTTGCEVYTEAKYSLLYRQFSIRNVASTFRTHSSDRASYDRGIVRTY